MQFLSWLFYFYHSNVLDIKLTGCSYLISPTHLYTSHAMQGRALTFHPGDKTVVPNNPPLNCLPFLFPPYLQLLLLLSGWHWVSRGKERQAEVMNLHCWGLPLQHLACSRDCTSSSDGGLTTTVSCFRFKTFLVFHFSYRKFLFGQLAFLTLLPVHGTCGILSPVSWAAGLYWCIMENWH